MSDDMLELIDSYFPTAYKLGDVGEVITANTLRNECKLDIIRTIYLPSRGHLTEIDMIGISPLGVFVIENKNYKGTIEGTMQDRYWKVRYNQFNFERLYNPVLQNELHRQVVRGLLESLGYLDVPVYNVVIFNDKGHLKLRDVEKNVFSLSSFIEVYNSVNKDLVSRDLQSKISSLLRKFSDISEDTKLLHLSLLRRKHEEDNTLADN